MGSGDEYFGTENVSRSITLPTDIGQSFEILQKVTSHASSKSNRVIIPGEWVDAKRYMREMLWLLAEARRRQEHVESIFGQHARVLEIYESRLVRGNRCGSK